MSILEDNNNQQYKLASVNNLQGLIVTINYPQENGLDKEFSSKKIEEDEILFGNGESPSVFSFGKSLNILDLSLNSCKPLERSVAPLFNFSEFESSSEIADVRISTASSLCCVFSRSLVELFFNSPVK